MQSCSNCFYRREARMPGQIQSTNVCAFDPPKVYVLPGGANGVQVAALQTQVSPDQWCGKWIQSEQMIKDTPTDFKITSMSGGTRRDDTPIDGT